MNDFLYFHKYYISGNLNEFLFILICIHQTDIFLKLQQIFFFSFHPHSADIFLKLFFFFFFFYLLNFRDCRFNYTTGSFNSPCCDNLDCANIVLFLFVENKTHSFLWESSSKLNILYLNSFVFYFVFINFDYLIIH